MTHTAKADAPTARAEPSYWTVQRMNAFIETLQRTHNVAAAARAAGMSRRSAYRLRARLPGHPFDRAWEAALVPRQVLERVVSDYARHAAP